MRRVEVPLAGVVEIVDEWLCEIPAGQFLVGFQASPVVVLEIEHSILDGGLLRALLAADGNTVFVCGPCGLSMLVDLILPDEKVSIDKWYLSEGNGGER